MAETNTLTTRIELDADVKGTEKVKGLKSAIDGVTGSVEELSSSEQDAAKSTEQAGNAAEKTGEQTKESGEKVKKATSKYAKFFNQLKRIATYRAIRTALKMITSGFKEGVQNLYQWSLANDNTFAKSMDSLATSTLYLKNALGTALAPVIEDVVVPAIYAISDAVAEAVNWFNQLIAILQGEGTYTKAIRKQTQFATATGSAAKELNRMLLGFDEINKLSDNSSSSGSSTDYSGMFETTDVELSLGEWTNFFEDLRDDIQPVIDDIKTMVTGLKDTITGVFSGNWEQALSGISTFFDGVRSFISDFVEFATNTISGLLEKFKLDVPDLFENLKLSVSNFFDSATEKINGFLDWLEEWSGIKMEAVKKVVSGAMDFLKTVTLGALTSLQTELPRIIDDINEILGGIADFVSGVLSGDWQKAWDGIVNIASGAFDIIRSIVEGVINTIVSALNWVIEKINSIEITFPDWYGLGEYAGQTWSPSLKTIGTFTWDVDEEETKPTSSSINWRDSSTKYKQSKDSGVSAIARANGGYVDSGSLFIAGESGAEFVGNINGRTGVMNTDQFSEANRPVTEAVYAIGSAIVGAVNGIEMPSVKIGDREIYKASERGKRLTGSSLVIGAR